MEYILLPNDILRLISIINIKCLQLLYSTNKEIRKIFNTYDFKKIFINKYLVRYNEKHLEYIELLASLPILELSIILSVPYYSHIKILRLRNYSSILDNFVNNKLCLNYIISENINILGNSMSMDHINDDINTLESLLLLIHPDHTQIQFYINASNNIRDSSLDYKDFWREIVYHMTKNYMGHGGNIDDIKSFCQSVSTICNVDINQLIRAMYSGGYGSHKPQYSSQDFWNHITYTDDSYDKNIWKNTGVISKVITNSSYCANLFHRRLEDLLEIGKEKENVDMYYFSEGWNRRNLNSTPIDQLFNWGVGYMISASSKLYNYSYHISIAKGVYTKLKEFDMQKSDLFYIVCMNHMKIDKLRYIAEDVVFFKNIFALIKISRTLYNDFIWKSYTENFNRDIFTQFMKDIHQEYIKTTKCKDLIRLKLLEKDYDSVNIYIHAITRQN
ncbi:Transmembrane domain-containing protein [Orpheovirus IHUMI-LCC2]|uniref:Transmembrane domain-containing protein n=1 Tax=Orpheovirus IHUMI-LCC2 TaxID=2023057 RepID=A0A2I2L420_9VIRU|nr:Transmembrane domain-containing protein [Orpheovirus IHUMI-LCC2]SNW62286.1 Transmembrane domain-containing protein [Orpheovirus IHUMI-LCC2]